MNNKPRHDEIFRKALENPIAAKEFISAHAPKELLEVIDLDSLNNLEKEKYITSDLINSSSDVLFSVNFKRTNWQAFFLVEHQSTVDNLIAYRMLKYKMSILERYLVVNPETKYLPLICPILVYNGDKKYNAPLSFWELSNFPNLAKKYWSEGYKLVNVNDINVEELKKRPWSGILEYFLKNIRSKKILKNWEEISDILPKLAEVKIGMDYISLFLYYTLTVLDKNDKMELEKFLINILNKQKGEELMGSLAQHWKDEGIEIGIQKGKAQGLAEGEVRGEAKLIRKMLKGGMNINLVSKHLGISVKEIEKMISDY
jgi:predicted transposase/invertase (TIGR01784 family)